MGNAVSKGNQLAANDLIEPQADSDGQRHAKKRHLDHKLVARHRRPVHQSQDRRQQHDDPACKLDRRGDVAEMNIFRRAAVHHLLELLLVLAALLLAGQLGWPGLIRWWHSPSPGAIGVDRYESNGRLADKYLVYLPEHYNEQSWPLIVFLHGSGSRGNEPDSLRDLGPFTKRLPAVVVAPQCLPTSHWESTAVADFVRHAASGYRIDLRRIYVVGYSMGGYGAWHAAVAYPELFAAMIPISGGGKPGQAELLTHLPVWAFHGADDEAVPAAESERMVEAIRAAGGAPKLTILPKTGHDICQSVCRRTDLWEWLLSQRRERIANVR